MSTGLVGTWHLSTWRNKVLETETIIYPFGEHPTGQVLYAPSGHFAMCMIREGRAPFLKDDPGLMSDTEAQSIGEDFFSYFGRYTFDGEAVYHHIEHCTIPNWEGQTKTRFVQIKGDQLILRTAPFVYKHKHTQAEVLWSRA